MKGNGDGEKQMHRNISRKQKEEVSSDEEQQESKRGRSKLERWTSHKERDFSINSKSSASLKFKQINKSNSNDGNSNSRASDVNKLQEEKPPATLDPLEKKDPNNSNPENKGGNSKPSDDRHLDTVEKLKKRSERFKLPMPVGKDNIPVKKTETEPLPSAKTETPADSEVKPERPARKRRWVSS